MRPEHVWREVVGLICHRLYAKLLCLCASQDQRVWAMQQDWRKPLLGAREPVWTGYRLSACEHQEGRTFEVRYRKPPPLAVVVDYEHVLPFGSSFSPVSLITICWFVARLLLAPSGQCSVRICYFHKTSWLLHETSTSAPGYHTSQISLTADHKARFGGICQNI